MPLRPPTPLAPRGVGVGSDSIQALAAELGLPSDRQDAEAIMQQLVSLAAVAIDAAAVHVLPAIEKEDA
jgi:hypothetical protein